METATSPTPPMISDLIARHHLTALAIEHAASIHVNYVLMALGKHAIHIREAKAILEGVNKLVGTQYALVDISSDCYYGGLVPGSMFEWKGDGNVYHGR